MIAPLTNLEIIYLSQECPYRSLFLLSNKGNIKDTMRQN